MAGALGPVAAAGRPDSLSLVRSERLSLPLSHQVLVFLLRLATAVTALVWIALGEERTDTVGIGPLPWWAAEVLAVLAYGSYSAAVYAMGRRWQLLHAAGLVVDPVFVSFLTIISGGLSSPFSLLYVALVAAVCVRHGLVAGVIQGGLSGLLWVAASVGVSSTTNGVAIGFALVGPLLVAFLLGALRVCHAVGAGQLPERAQSELAERLSWLVIAAGAAGGVGRARVLRGWFASAGAEWDAAGVRSVAVFARDDHGPLTLCWVHEAPELVAELGSFALEPDDLHDLACGTAFLPAGSELVRQAAGFFHGWTRGEAAVVTACDQRGPSLVAVASSRARRFGDAERRVLSHVGDLVRTRLCDGSVAENA